MSSFLLKKHPKLLSFQHSPRSLMDRTRASEARNTGSIPVEGTTSMKNKNTILVLHNIRSAYNVGAIFRTADACGIGMIYLVGYTPAPIDEFGRINSGIAKSAIGAEKTVPWKKVKNIGPVLTKLKKEKFQIIAIEQSKNSVDYKKIKSKFPCAFILGEEVSGLTKNILDKCDVVAEIPMKGQKESLNVSVAAGVALFRILEI